MSSICLTMIVKNESHCIARCLKSILPFISYWVISDTGSTDNTENVIRETLKDIPGELHKNDWIDFSTNRNIVLKLADGKADYKLMIDADDYWEGTIPELSASVYDILIQHANTTYHRPQLFRSDLAAEYKGVLHEFLSFLASTPSQKLEDCKIIFGGSGSRSKDPMKFLKDCEVFEKAMLTDPSPRNTFYYAQSLRDAGKHSQALFQYLKRFKMGDWIEERYISMLEAAKLYERLNPNDFNTIESMYLTAYTCLPTRSEALHYLSLYFRNQKQFDKAFVYAKCGLSIGPHEGLFVEPACYQWKMKDEAAVSAYWIWNKEEARQLNKELLNNPYLPESEKPRIKQNLAFCD